MNNVVLIGFRGSGKTTFGRAMAKILGQPFVDLDEQIEFVLGETIYEFVDKYGWQKFREVEQKVTHDCSRNFSGVLATGGGTLENSKNLQNLKKGGKFVFLNPPFSEVKSYLLKDKTRPRLNLDVPHAQEIDQLWQQRKDIYAAVADYEVNPSIEGDIMEEAQKIVEALPQNLFPPVPPKKTVAIFSSSNGSTFQGLIEAQKNGRIPNVEFGLFVTNKKDSGALQKAKDFGVDNIEVFPVEEGMEREEYDRGIINILRGHKLDAILLVGWMRIFSRLYCDQFGKFSYNVHPSLLPKFAGLMGDQVHEQVLEYEEKYAGCTIHRVSDVLDGGEVVLQRRILVDADDTVPTLRKKVQKQEVLGFCELLERR